MKFTKSIGAFSLGLVAFMVFSFWLSIGSVNGATATGLTLGKTAINIATSSGPVIINRGQFCRFLVETFGLTNESATNPFSDLSSDNEYYHDIMKVYEAGLMRGDEDGTFDVYEEVPRAGYAAVMIRALGYSVATDQNTDITDIAGLDLRDYIITAVNAGLMEVNSDGEFKPNDSMKLDLDGQLIPIIQPLDATNKKVVWSSDNETIATVDSTGKVKGLSNGTAAITAKSTENDSISAACAVTVADVPVTSLSLSKTTLKMAAYSEPVAINRAQFCRFLADSLGLTEMCDSTAFPFTDVPATDEYYAAINKAYTAGLVRGTEETTFAPTGEVTRAGYAAVMIRALGYPVTTDQYTVANDIDAHDLKDYINTAVNAGIMTVNSNGEFKPDDPMELDLDGQLIPIIKPVNATNKKVIWTSDNENFATVDSTGRISGKPSGTAVITAQSNADSTKTANCNVTVLNPINIGFIAPLSDSYGISARKGFDLALEQAAYEAGGYIVKPIYEDDQSDVTLAKTAANSLISQGVSAIVGSDRSSVTIPISEIANSNNIVLITGSASSPDVTVANNVRKSYIFRSCFIDPYEAATAAAFTKNNLQKTTAAILYDPNDGYSYSLAESFKTAFTSAGGQILCYAAVSYDDTNNSYTIPSGLTSSDPPDVVYLPFYYEEANTLGSMIRTAGINATFIGCSGWYWTAGFDSNTSLNDGYLTNYYANDDPRSEVQAFKTAYNNKYSCDPDVIAALFYDAAKLLLKAVDTADTTDPAVIRDKLQATTGFPGVSGEITYFTSSGNPSKAVIVQQIQNGQMVYYSSVLGESEDTTPPQLFNVTAITAGKAISVTSNEDGYIYLVPPDTTVTADAVRTAGQGSSGKIVAVSSGIAASISTIGIIPGNYKVYAIDTAGNLSAGSEISVTLVKVTNTKNGNQYALIHQGTSWAEAKAYCEKLGGHLATITSIEEQSIIENLLASGIKTYYWLGGTDAASEGNWTWITGETLSYSNWTGVEPNNYDAGEACLMADKSGLWYDLDNECINHNNQGGQTIMGLICEWEGTNDKDTTPPEIILIGEAAMSLTVGSSFNDPGATASDNVDGNITSSIQVSGDTVNTAAIGTYVIRYNVMDAAGNAAVEKTRTVIVAATGTADECFIATAAFGSKLQPAVVLLRHFRDQCLLTNAPGRAFVNFYYHHSPPIAAYIVNSEPLKALVRILLLPLIGAAYAIMHPAVGIVFIGMLLFLLILKKNRTIVVKN